MSLSEADALAQSAPAAVPPQSSSQQSPSQQPLGPEQLEQILAPIALYPDDLIVQVLTAATYPLEVVVASRWAAEPKHAALKGDALGQAVMSESWDPSVKSLVIFPSVLKTMSSRLEWTQQLGDAFLAQPQDCMAAIQRLRARASNAGKLKSTSQQKVTTQGDTIIIEPADPQVVYVPAYSPAAVYGTWPYPTYPPYAFPPAPGYPVAAGLAAGIAFGAGVAIAANTWGWGWGHADWRAGNININVQQFTRINNNRTNIIAGNTWQHNAIHRHGVAYRNAATRARFGRQTAGAAARADFRGRAAGHGAAGRIGAGGIAQRGGIANHTAIARQSFAAARGSRVNASAFHVGNGAQTRAFAQRGSFSRQQSARSFQGGGFRGGGFRGGGGGFHGGFHGRR